MPERSQKSWQLVRLSMVLCWFLWLVTFFIAVTLLQAVFHVHVVAQVARNIDREFSSFKKDFVQALPLETLGTADQEKIDEMFLRYYLEMRYTRIPDEDEMERRWGPGGIVARMSSGAVYWKTKLDFERAANEPPIIVDIRNIERDKRKLEYQVILDLYQFDGSSSWVKRTRSVRVTAAHSVDKPGQSRNYSNPYGFYIVGLDDKKSFEE